MVPRHCQIANCHFKKQLKLGVEKLRKYNRNGQAQKKLRFQLNFQLSFWLFRSLIVTIC